MNRRVVGAALVVVMVFAGCASADDDVAGPESVSTEPGSTDPDGSTTSPTASTGAPPDAAIEITWEECSGGYECGFADVPLDYDDPDGDTYEIGMLRVPARDPDNRIGSLFVNPGGPGGSASETAAALDGGLPDDILDRFDLIGLDPRGVGLSTPLDCEEGVVEMYAADPTMEDQADIDAYKETSEAFVEDCTEGQEDVLQNVGTRTVARDMDLVREALGDEGLTYLGYSYGTAIGQVYADLFPDHIRAMVLDGVLDLSRPGIEVAASQGEGFETAFNRWAADCDADPSCALTGGAVAAFERVMAKAEAEPIPAPVADRPAGPGEVQMGVTSALYSQGRWNTLARAIAEAEDGDGSGLVELADDYLNFGGFGVYFGVNCLDSGWPSFDGVLAAGKDAATQAPHFGEATVNDYARCSIWPAEPDPIAPPEAVGSPPIVVVSTTGDPATPYQAGVDLAELLPDGRLISYEGDGHTVVYNGVRCVDDPVTSYLVDLEAPPERTDC